MKSYALYKRYLRRSIHLQKEEEERVTHAEIVAGTTFSGYNLWVLGFAMIMACVGLITNSMTAVIGAMLISPLMGPVIGFSFGLAINNKHLKIQGIHNFIVMTTVSLAAAFIFFLLNPFKENTGLLNTYMQPTIFDIMLAFFGGMAGFIGIVKKDGTKIIAGVAVATACMPPLCTTAFGLAHANWTMALGGFYFYLVNSLFIGLANFLFCNFSGFVHPKVKHKSSPLAKWLWSLLIIAMILPGTYIAYQKWVEQHDSHPVTDLTNTQRITQLEKKVFYLDSLLRQQKK